MTNVFGQFHCTAVDTHWIVAVVAIFINLHHNHVRSKVGAHVRATQRAPIHHSLVEDPGDVRESSGDVLSHCIFFRLVIARDGAVREEMDGALEAVSIVDFTIGGNDCFTPLGFAQLASSTYTLTAL